MGVVVVVVMLIYPAVSVANILSAGGAEVSEPLQSTVITQRRSQRIACWLAKEAMLL